jgi:hypothetical protein
MLVFVFFVVVVVVGKNKQTAHQFGNSSSSSASRRNEWTPVSCGELMEWQSGKKEGEYVVRRSRCTQKEGKGRGGLLLSLDSGQDKYKPAL